jgi:hypothetical protein
MDPAIIAAAVQAMAQVSLKQYELFDKAILEPLNQNRKIYAEKLLSSVPFLRNYSQGLKDQRASNQFIIYGILGLIGLIVIAKIAKKS